VREIVEDEVSFAQEDIETTVINTALDKEAIVEEVADEVESRLH
jgi:hypothetical protein